MIPTKRQGRLTPVSLFSTVGICAALLFLVTPLDSNAVKYVTCQSSDKELLLILKDRNDPRTAECAGPIEVTEYEEVRHWFCRDASGKEHSSTVESELKAYRCVDQPKSLIELKKLSPPVGTLPSSEQLSGGSRPMIEEPAPSQTAHQFALVTTVGALLLGCMIGGVPAAIFRFGIAKSGLSRVYGGLCAFGLLFILVGIKQFAFNGANSSWTPAIAVAFVTAYFVLTNKGRKVIASTPVAEAKTLASSSKGASDYSIGLQSETAHPGVPPGIDPLEAQLAQLKALREKGLISEAACKERELEILREGNSSNR